MKKLVCIAFLLLAAVLCLASCGKDKNPQGLAFFLKDDGTYAVEIGNAKYLSRIEIPSTYKGKTVTEVGNFRLSSDSPNKLREILIPDSVTIIAPDAFEGYTNLLFYCEAASPPSGWSSSWKPFNCLVVWDCKNNDVATDGYIYTQVNGIYYALKDGNAIVIHQPDSISCAIIEATLSYKKTTYNVTSISSDAFKDCKSLTSVTIPNGVTSIGYSAFYGCSALTSVVIPNSVTSIGYRAFYGCSALTSVVFPNSITSVGHEAFFNCEQITAIYYTGNEQEWFNFCVNNPYPFTRFAIVHYNYIPQ